MLLICRECGGCSGGGGGGGHGHSGGGNADWGVLVVLGVPVDRVTVVASPSPNTTSLDPNNFFFFYLILENHFSSIDS